MRLSVKQFAVAMEKTLKKHDEAKGKDSWRNEPNLWLLERAQEELNEVVVASKDFDENKIIRELPDVANFLMMIYDNLTSRKKEGTL